MKPICRVQVRDEMDYAKWKTRRTLLATSRASWSAVNRTYAFFFPSGLRDEKRQSKIIPLQGRNVLTG